jgi:hypothetical protein
MMDTKFKFRFKKDTVSFPNNVAVIYQNGEVWINQEATKEELVSALRLALEYIAKQPVTMIEEK